MTSEPGQRERHSILEDLQSPDGEVRRLAVERAVTLSASESIPLLVESLGDSDWRVRKATVERLVACAESEQVIDVLIGALGDGENPGRRNAAVEALVGCGERAVGRLASALENGDADVRKLVVDATAGIGSPAGRTAMREALKDPDPNVRAAAAEALGVLGGDEAPRALMATIARDEEDRLVRLSALRALGRMEFRLTARDVAASLDDPLLRPAALALLGRVADDETTECLLKNVVAASRGTREAAAEALLRSVSQIDGAEADALVARLREVCRGSESLVADAIDRIAEADLSTRLVLVQFLGLVGGERCVVPILRAGRDEAIAELAHVALEALGAEAESALDAAWQDLDAELRRDACAVLGRVGGKRAEVRLLETLDDAPVDLRAAAARALGERRCGAALPALVRRLEASSLDEEPDSEDEVAALIGTIVVLAHRGRPDPVTLAAEAIALLSSRLEGAAERVRLSISGVLGQIGRPEDADLLVSLLKDPSADVRRAAVQALGSMQSHAAVEPMRLALADESTGVRVAAAGALAHSRHPDGLQDLKRLIEDEDPRVRAAALRSIGVYCSREASEASAQTAVSMVGPGLSDEGGVALAAAEALRSVGGAPAAVAATGLLARSEPELVQAAIVVIGAHGDSATVEELLALISHENWAVRADAIRILAERSVAKAVPPILRRLETEQDDFVRDAILRALERLGD